MERHAKKSILRGTLVHVGDCHRDGLRAVGLECEKPCATFYVWVSTPKGLSSAEFTTKLLEEAGVVTTPGNGFGAAGEGYVRFTVCVDKSKLKEVAERIRQVKL